MALDCHRSLWAGASSLTFLTLAKDTWLSRLWSLTYTHVFPGRVTGISNIEEM